MVVMSIVVVFITLLLMYIYISSILSANLYSSERNEMYEKAEIISDTVELNWYDYRYEIVKDNSYNWLDDIVGRSLSGSMVRGILTDMDNTVIYDTSKNENLAGEELVNEVLEKAISGENSHSLKKAEDGNKVLSVAVPINVDDEQTGVVYLTANTGKLEDIISSTHIGMIMFSLIILVLTGFLSIGISVIFTSPIEGFIEVAKEISKGNFKKRIEVKGEGEIAQLSESMNYMCAELEHLDERRRKFVSDASHELKTPMATIKLLCDSIVSTENPDIEMVKEFLNDLSDEIDRLTRLIDSLLTLTKLDSAEAEIKLVLVDFGILLKKIEKKLSAFATKRNIVLYTEILTDDMQPVLVDEDKIWEAVYNVIDNAIKYSKIGTAVKVTAQIDEEKLIVSVSDSGEGIPDEYKERVFERFYRLDDSRARDTGGTGLGLAIVKETVEMHNGSVRVVDNENGGSTFIIELPYKTGVPV